MKRNPCKPEQLTAYNAAAEKVEQAAKLLEEINLAKLDGIDMHAVGHIINGARQLRHQLFTRAYDRFIVDRYGEES